MDSRPRVVPKADPELDWAWRPPEDVVSALNRGNAKVREYYQRQAYANARKTGMHCRILRDTVA